MQINLARLKLQPRGSESFHLEEQGHNKILEDLEGKFLRSIVVDLDVDNNDRLFLGHGRVKTLLQLPCSRCLEDINYPIDTDFELTMEHSSKAHNYSEDEDTIIFDGDIVDLDLAVHAAIFMAIPIMPLCSESCRGICPVCGVNKNTGDCTCSRQEIDPRWEKLKNL